MILSGSMAGKRFDVLEGGLRLGRSSSNDIHIPDEELSRNHCLFEPDGRDGVRVIDLASANGTYVNSVQLGAEPKVLKVGDIIEAGRTALKIVENGVPEAIVRPPEPPPPVVEPINQPASNGTPVDLGLGEGTRGADIVADASSGWGKKNSLRVNILWGVVAILVASAIALVLLMPPPEGDDDVSPNGRRLAAEASPSPAVSELRYEKVDADERHIFRFAMSIDANGMMSVTCDDVPGEMRHIEKKKQLDQKQMAHIAKIFAYDGWKDLDSAYTGSSSMDENRLESYKICAMGGGRIREVLVENTSEPEAFRHVREALEAFSRNELGIWALQYSRDELMKLVKASEDLGDAKWNDRDVQYGNLAAAVAAYREAKFYMETLEPKPDGFRELGEKLDAATTELDKRYKDQRFIADRAINLGDWETARKELRTLLDIVTDQEDTRHTEAKAKLVDVEKRLSRKKGSK